MELDSFFSVDALKDLDWFLREVDMLDEAIIIKDNRPMYRIVRIGSKADRRDTTPVIKRVDLWTAMRQFGTVQVPSEAFLAVLKMDSN